MQTSGTYEECCWFLPESVFTPIGTGVSDGSIDCVSKIDLALDRSYPSGRVGVLEIGHVNIRPRVQGVYHHLPIDWPCYFHASPSEVGGDRGYAPRGIANFSGLF